MISGIPSVIASSQTVIAKVPIDISTGANYLGGMQIAPDGKIYIARANRDTLAVINNPNALGAACNFQFSSVVLIPPGVALGGISNFIDANNAGIQINIPDVQQCNTFTATTLDAGAGFSNYYWSTGAGTQTISINSPGKYWVTVTNQQGCTRTDTISAYLITPQKYDTLTCDTFHVNVIQGGGLQYNWFDGNHSPTRNFTQSGSYYVDIGYLNGCSVRDSVNVTIVPSPKVDLGPDTSFCRGDLILDASCSSCSYQWNTAEISSTIFAKSPGIFWVRVQDVKGCIGSDTLVVHPQSSAFNYILPNIVTPNNDGINDEINFQKYQFAQFNIDIYNRWGQKVFESDDPNAIWKPTGDEGTYFYIGKARIDCGTVTKESELRGYITLMR
jgi:gliding motility-associated-like protein